MVRQPDLPGPGEHVGPEHLQPEASSGPIPEGELPGGDAAQDRRRHTVERLPAHSFDADDVLDGHCALRRTGTDRVALPPVRARVDALERRLDHSAHDLQRETASDPTPDNAGP